MLKTSIFFSLFLLGSCAPYWHKHNSLCGFKPIVGTHGIPFTTKYFSQSFHGSYPSQNFAHQSHGYPSKLYSSHGHGYPSNYGTIQEVPLPEIHHDFGGYQSNDFSSHGFSQNLVAPAIQLADLSHHKVVAVAHDEAKLPAQLKNPFYKNPHVRNALAKHSWFGPGEMPVGLRETDKIPRQQIYMVLHNAGLLGKH